MSKVVSAIFGIGIAVVVYVCMLLGIQAFYPAPEYDDFCEERDRIAKPLMEFEGCADDITVAECRKQTQEQRINEEEENVKQEQCYEKWDDARDDYGRNFFIIAQILGVLAIITAYFLLNITSVSIVNISSGVAISGIIMILWGFMRGWESTDDKLKFVVGLVIAAIVIALTVKLNKKGDRRK